MTVGPDGLVVPVAKIKGQRKAIKYILEGCASTIEQPEDQTVYICHADCPGDASVLKLQVEELIKPKAVVIRPVGPVIGSHCGPGTLAIVYFGKGRDELLLK